MKKTKLGDDFVFSERYIIAYMVNYFKNEGLEIPGIKDPKPIFDKIQIKVGAVR